MTRLSAPGHAACAAVLLLVAPAVFASPESVRLRGITETVLAFKAADLRKQNLPERVTVLGAPHVYGSQLNLACLGIPLQPTDVLLYFTQSKKCSVLDPRSAHRAGEGAQREEVEALTAARPELARMLAESQLVVLQPKLQAPVLAGLCICPTANPPVASVQSGSPQDVLVSQPIQSVVFVATDPDTPSLSHEFSYTLDGGAIQAGLPGALGASCTPGVGTLECTVGGSAPAQDGAYVLRFVASDGSGFALATATLNVFVDLPNELLIFLDGFEDQ